MRIPSVSTRVDTPLDASAGLASPSSPRDEGPVNAGTTLLAAALLAAAASLSSLSYCSRMAAKNAGSSLSVGALRGSATRTRCESGSDFGFDPAAGRIAGTYAFASFTPPTVITPGGGGPERSPSASSALLVFTIFKARSGLRARFTSSTGRSLSAPSRRARSSPPSALGLCFSSLLIAPFPVFIIVAHHHSSRNTGWLFGGGLRRPPSRAAADCGVAIAFGFAGVSAAVAAPCAVSAARAVSVAEDVAAGVDVTASAVVAADVAADVAAPGTVHDPAADGATDAGSTFGEASIGDDRNEGTAH